MVHRKILLLTRVAILAIISAALVACAPVHSGASGKLIPSDLKDGIIKTIAEKNLRADTELDVISPKLDRKSTSTPLDCQSPDRVETEPRTINIGGHLFGATIYVGNTVYVHWPFPSGDAKFSKMTEGSAQSPGGLEQGLCFYPLLLALQATSFSEHDGTFDFSNANGVHGYVIIRNGLVTKASVNYLVAKSSVGSSQNDRRTAEYSLYDHEEAITPPPKSRVT